MRETLYVFIPERKPTSLCPWNSTYFFIPERNLLFIFLREPYLIYPYMFNIPEKNPTCLHPWEEPYREPYLIYPYMFNIHEKNPTCLHPWEEPYLFIPLKGIILVYLVISLSQIQVYIPERNLLVYIPERNRYIHPLRRILFSLWVQEYPVGTIFPSFILIRLLNNS